MKKVRLYGTTNGSGALTVNGPAVSGLLYAVQLIDGSFADGVDITLTCENADYSIPLLVKADFNSDQMVYPRVDESLNTDGSALNSYAAYPLLSGNPKMVIANGGDTLEGGCILYYIEA